MSTSGPLPATGTDLLRLGLQLRVVLLEEGANLVGHREQLLPLLLVERDRKASQPVDRHAAFLAHLQADAAPALRLQPLVLRLQPLELRPQILVRHNTSSSSIRDLGAG